MKIIQIAVASGCDDTTPHVVYALTDEGEIYSISDGNFPKWEKLPSLPTQETI